MTLSSNSDKRGGANGVACLGADASAEQTDADSFAPLEPPADGFRNDLGKGHERSAEELMVDHAQLLTPSGPEMTVLVGGMRVLDNGTEWKATDDTDNMFEGRDRATGAVKWTGTRCDLIFGSNPQLRAISEVYGSSDANSKFVNDFVAAWVRVMSLDRFDAA